MDTSELQEAQTRLLTLKQDWQNLPRRHAEEQQQLGKQIQQEQRRLFALQVARWPQTGPPPRKRLEFFLGGLLPGMGFGVYLAMFLAAGLGRAEEHSQSVGTLLSPLENAAGWVALLGLPLLMAFLSWRALSGKAHAKWFRLEMSLGFLLGLVWLIPAVLSPGPG